MKAFFSVISVIALIVTPLATITPYHTSQFSNKINNNYSANPTPQFNNSAFDYSDSNGYDYYAYYKDNAFTNPYGDHDDYGYVCQISTGNGNEQNLQKIYEWWVLSKKDINETAEEMISYLMTPTGAPHSVVTPYSNSWTYTGHFLNDVNDLEQSLFFGAFNVNASLNTQATNLMLNAVKNNQNLKFRFYSAYTNTLHINMWGWIYIENMTTAASVTSDPAYGSQPI